MANVVRVLIAEDQESERLIYNHALKRIGVGNFYFVEDGVEAIDWLRGINRYTDRHVHPFPTCMLLDLKMPRKNGFDVLQWMLEHPDCRVIPTIMMSNSSQEKDITTAYKLGVNAFFTKPTQLREMIDVLALIHHFWTISQRPQFGENYSCG